MKRILSLLLCLCMMFSLCTAAFADGAEPTPISQEIAEEVSEELEEIPEEIPEEDAFEELEEDLEAVPMVIALEEQTQEKAAEEKEEKSPRTIKLVTSGDSTSHGYLLDDYCWQHVHPEGASQTSEFVMVKKYLEAKGYIVDGADVSLTGMRPTELRAILDESYYARVMASANYASDHLNQYINTWKAYGSYEALHDAYISNMKDADIIVLDMAMANLSGVLGLTGDPQPLYAVASYSDLLAQEGCEYLAGSLAELRANLEKLTFGVFNDANTLVDNIMANLTADVINFSKSLDMIYDMNPDVDLIVVSPYNQMDGYYVNLSGVSVNLGAISELVVNFSKNYFISLDKHCWRYRYANCGQVGTLQQAMARGEFDTHQKMVSEIFKYLFGISNPKTYYPEAKYNAMLANLKTACAIREIDVDIVTADTASKEFIARGQKALRGDKDATQKDYQALAELVYMGLNHAGGTHPDEIGYQQKFNAIKLAMESRLAANGTLLNSIYDHNRTVVRAMLGDKDSQAELKADAEKALSPFIKLSCAHETIKLVAAKEPTKLVPGNIEHYRCAKCGDCFSDEAGIHPISRDSVIVPYVEPPKQLDAPVITYSGRSITKRPMLNWLPVLGASCYDVYRGDTADGDFVKVETTLLTSFADLKAKTSAEYYYRVVARPASSKFIESSATVFVGKK